MTLAELLRARQIAKLAENERAAKEHQMEVERVFCEEAAALRNFLEESLSPELSATLVAEGKMVNAMFFSDDEWPQVALRVVVRGMPILISRVHYAGEFCLHVCQEGSQFHDYHAMPALADGETRDGMLLDRLNALSHTPRPSRETAVQP